MPEVSIIMPVYNPNSKWLVDAVDSIIDQSFTDFELLIVDDGSDNPSACDDFTEWDDRIKVLRHDYNMNQASALNTGLRNAKGEFICFLDCDDLFIEDKLDKQLTFFSTNSDADMIYADGWYLHDDGITEYNLNDNPENLLNWNIVCVGSVMVRKKVFDEVSYFDTNLDRSHDWDMWIRVYKAGFKIQKMEERCGIYYRLHPGQKSKNINANKAHNYIKEKHSLKGGINE